MAGSHGVFAISVVAEMVAMPAQNLRVYERHGLLESRTDRGRHAPLQPRRRRSPPPDPRPARRRTQPRRHRPRAARSRPRSRGSARNATGSTGVDPTVTSGGWILLASVLLAVGFGVYRASADGRFRGTRPLPEADGSRPEAAPAAVESLVPDDQLGERATLLQFSSAFCAPCRATRRVLADVADRRPRRDSRRDGRGASPRPGPPGRRDAHAHHAGARRRGSRGHPGRRCPAQGAGARRPRRDRGVMSTSWMHVSTNGTTVTDPSGRRPTVSPMSSTMLTKRRAVDHCLVRSAMCRMS